jgi:hypothetical protein
VSKSVSAQILPRLIPSVHKRGQDYNRCQGDSDDPVDPKLLLGGEFPRLISKIKPWHGKEDLAGKNVSGSPF